MAVAQAILNGLGYAGTHLKLLRARNPTDLDAGLQALSPHPPDGARRPRVLPWRKKSAARWSWRWTT
jgi:hypothetical protein